MALAVAAGALAWWGTKAMRENGVAHGLNGGDGRSASGARSMGGDESSASSL